MNMNSKKKKSEKVAAPEMGSWIYLKLEPKRLDILQNKL